MARQHHIGTTVTPFLRQRIRKAAEQDGLSQAELLRNAVVQYVKEVEKLALETNEQAA